MILLFLTERPHWWQVEAGRIMARGAGTPPPHLPVLAVPPPASVSLHRITLPRLAPAQAQAAARMMASELAAAPAEKLHTAITAPDAQGQRWLAVAGQEAMQGWVDALAALGVAAPLVPAPLLLPVPSRLDMDGLALVHMSAAAFAAEADLLPLIAPDAPPPGDETLLAARVEAALAAPPLDLRQGRFAQSQPFRLAAGQRRRLLLLLAVLVVALVGADAAHWWRATSALATAEATRDALATRLLPPGTPLIDPRAQVEAEAARAVSGGFTARTAALMAALQARPGVTLAALQADATSLTATLETASPGDVAAIAQMMEDQGLATNAGLPRDSAGRRQVDLKVSMK